MHQALKLYRLKIARCCTALALTFTSLGLAAVAQTIQENDISPDAGSLRLAATTLPDDPSTALIHAEENPEGRESGAAHIPRLVSVRLITAPKYATAIEPEYCSEDLGAAGKVSYGMHELFSYRFPGEVLISAGLSRGADTDPLYGKNREAFAQRVGAAGARQASQIVFADMVMAPLLHEDPRYYVMGPEHSTFKRVGYAATRVLFTQTDRGKTTPNFALLAGYGGSAALTQLYYPVRSRDTATVLSGYGLSLGGRAIGYEFQEFFRFLSRKQPPQGYRAPQ